MSDAYLPLRECHQRFCQRRLEFHRGHTRHRRQLRLLAFVTPYVDKPDLFFERLVRLRVLLWNQSSKAARVYERQGAGQLERRRRLLSGDMLHYNFQAKYNRPATP